MRLGSIVVLLFATAASLAAREPLTIGGVTARPGERVSGWIDVSGADGAAKIPVTVAHGVQPGPVLTLIAGTHGSEYTAIVALGNLRPRLDPSKMKGSVILIHMASPGMFYGRRVYYGLDGKNPNRMFPGDPNGTVSERTAHALTQVIDRSTHVADMHCGDGNESLRPYAYWMPIGDAGVDEAAREMLLAFGLDHIIIDRERPSDPKKTLYTSTTAMVRGKPAITVESGGMGMTDDASVAAQEAGALSLINHLGIMEAPSVRVSNPVWYEKSEVLRASVTGVWRAAVDKMESVAKGALIGRIFDPFGNVLSEVRAPFTGEMMYVVGTPPVTQGEPLGMIAVPKLDE